MPGLIGVSEFVEETREDYNSPTTSTFVSRMPQFRQTIAALEETLDFDRDGLTKMKKAVKAIHNSGNSHVDNEMYLSRALERLGSAALSKDQEPDIGAAFIKFSVVTKELSALMKTLMQNVNNIVMFPLENLLKGDLKGVKGDLKRPFDRACKEYEARYARIEKEKKQQAREAGLIRTEVTSAEVADEMDKERKVFQLQMCEYLIKVNEIKTKKGIELLQHLVEYYHAQTNYFQDGLKTIEHFGGYVQDLSSKLHRIRQKQDEERRRLLELRTLLRSAPGLDKELTPMTSGGTTLGGTGGLGSSGGGSGGGSGLIGSSSVSGGSLGSSTGGYSLHQPQGDKQAGTTRVGYLMKKSEGKMRKVWQKRKCQVGEGFLDVCHGDESKPPTRVNLLTCQIKMVPDDRRCFDLISYNRTYHFQAEDENDQRAWMSVLVNCKEGALMKAFDDPGGVGGGALSPSLLELQQAIIRYVQRLPGNDKCCDCNSHNDATWLSTNFGVMVCIECSGIHRDLGVHISRIQSLTLDHLGTAQLLLARHNSNLAFNDVMEATLHPPNKPHPGSSMEERYEFIRAKYVDKRYVLRTCSNEHDLLCELEQAVNSRQLSHLLQAFAEGADLSAPLPSSETGETALHVAILQAEEGGPSSGTSSSAASTSSASSTGTSLHIVDFLIQNGGGGSGGVIEAPTRVGSLRPLHYCAMHGRSECMKLLLRSGADPCARSGQDKTPLELAEERGHAQCAELLQHAMQRQKGYFDNVDIDWNLSYDEGSTDFSDDETIVEDRNGSVTPEKKSRLSRPPSYAGQGNAGGPSPLATSGPESSSPVNLRSRSSTSDSLKSSSSPREGPSGGAGGFGRGQMPPPPPPQNRKPSVVSTSNVHGSLKKRAAPPPPSVPSPSASPSPSSSSAASQLAVGCAPSSSPSPSSSSSSSSTLTAAHPYATLPSAGHSHSRTTSDPVAPSPSTSTLLLHHGHHHHGHHIHSHMLHHSHLHHQQQQSPSGVGGRSQVNTTAHKRSPSSDSAAVPGGIGSSQPTTRSSIPAGMHLAGAKLVLPPGEHPVLKPTACPASPSGSASPSLERPMAGGVQRPRGPPPPAPPLTNSPPGMRMSQTALANGRSNESISSVSSDLDVSGVVRGNPSNPVPPPRKKKDRARLESYAEEGDLQLTLPYFFCPLQNLESSGVLTNGPRDESSCSAVQDNEGASTRNAASSVLRRCRALYDCEADNEDELSFREGEVIIVTDDQTEDDNWMEGRVEGDPGRRGMFPVSFVHMLSD
ncbi:arfGAP with SH3 domain, ANK repeat and PH domain-containing protein [Ischnura elegans]|uniref:arfGAP with SH3 domain, ANK repeat and PH domain-containing protein n=1 Tax=Ischnura elegans TaxID=197161 RepID=UPI001ED89C26|nr:arfGAP with SH3 domain, ANK repeat and PH domain-containing protein [Ischnura elegans]